jgi:hypothetical protein
MKTHVLERKLADEGGQKECQGIKGCHGKDIRERVHVNLPIDEDAPELWPRKLFILSCWSCIDQQPLDGQMPLILRKKMGCLRVIWEVNEGDEAQKYCW